MRHATWYSLPHGVQFVLKPQIGIVLNLEYAVGKDGNSGLILKTGYTF